MDRKRQDFYTKLLAGALLLSQLMPFIPRRPELVAGAFGLLGVIPIRKAQDEVNKEEAEK